MDKNKAIKIIEQAKEHALNKMYYYAFKNNEITKLWQAKYNAYELARRALIKDSNYDINVYGRE